MITRALDACSDKWWEADGELVPSRRSGCVIPILIVTMSASRGWELMNEIETYVKQKLGEQTGKSSESKKAEKSSERKEKKEAKKTPKDSSSASAMDSDKLAYSSQIVCCLYGKHTKVHEQAKEMRKKRYFCVGVGTPGRLLRLLEEKVPEGKKEGKGDKRSDLKYERSKEGLEKEKKKRSRYEEESEEEEKEEEEEGDGEKKQHSSEAESKPCANSLLRTDDVRLLVIDMFHNQKNFCIFTLGDTKGAFGAANGAFEKTGLFSSEGTAKSTRLQQTIPSNSSNSNYLFLLSNSSLKLNDIFCIDLQQYSITALDGESSLLCFNTKFVYSSKALTPFASSGSVLFSNVSIDTCTCKRQLPSIVNLQNEASSGVKLINSCFSDFTILSRKSSSLLCSGIGNYEAVDHCYFANVTAKVKTGNEASAKENCSFVISSAIKLSTFIHVHDAFYGGVVHGLSFTSPSQDFICDLCEFYECSHSTPSSLFHVSRAKQSITGKNANVTSTIFKDCTGTNGGGLFYDGEIWGTINYNLTVLNCTFENCTANYGGGIYINEVGYGTIKNNVFYDCKATNNLGPDFYVYNFDWTTKDVDITFSSSFTYNDGNRVYIDGTNYSKLIKMDQYQIAASNGSTTVNCGLSVDVACKSVNTAISNRRPNYLKRIKLLNGTYNENDSWVINSTRGKVDAFGESQTKVIFNLNKYSATSMISISGAVNATISTFTINVNKNSFRIIYGSSGNFNLSVSDITISTPSDWMTELSDTKYPKSLAFNSCSISSISSLHENGTNGGAICLSTDDSQINFSNTTFTSCCVSQSSGRGGALYFSTSGSLSKFSISSCKFSSNQAYFGRDVFICVPSLPNANVDSYYSAAVTATYVPNRTNAWFGRDNATFRGDFDLMPFIFGYTSSIIHASNASRGDGKYCGSVIAHCRTITQAIQRLNGSSRTIKANGTVKVSYSGTEVSNVVISRNDSSATATIIIDGIAGTANSAFISSGAFQSQNIVYSIGSVPQGSSVQKLLSGTSGTQTFSNCIFVGSASNALTIALVSISGGRLVLESTSFNASSELCCSCSLFSLQNGIFKFSESRFANLKFTSSKAGLISQLVSGSSSQKIELSNCGFERISSTKETSSCVVISSSTGIGSFNATSCNFSSSSCTASINGGAISFAVGANKKFEINRCLISSNTASESAGKGGGVFLLLKDISSDYKITGCSFESNKAKYGRDIYIQAPNLNSCVTFEKFGNLLTPTTDVENMMCGCNASSIDQHIDLIFLMTIHLAIVNVKNAGSEHGEDWFRCGNESEPCKTFEYGMDKILDSTATNKGISIVSQAVISKPIELSSMTVFPSWSSTFSTFRFDFTMGVFDAAIFNHDALSFNKIKLYLPSVQNVLKTLILTDNFLNMNNASFESEQLDSSVFLHVIEVKEGTVVLNNCSIGEHSFRLESSFMKYAGSSAITMNNISVGMILLCAAFFSETAGGRSTLLLKNISFDRCSASPQAAMSPIISSQLEGSVNIEECDFRNVGNAKCKEGGVINVWLKDTGKIKIAGCQVGECFCDEATGKGGFLYLSKRQSEGQYDLSVESEYSNNKAHIGKNLFFYFDSLNESVSADRLFLPVDDPAVEGGKAYVGKDAIFDSMDLAAFLVQFVSNKVHVSSTGYDILRCGSADFPCHSIWRGLKNVKNDSSDKEIILDTLVKLESCFEFLDLTLSASSTSKEAGITIFSDLSPSNKDAVIDISGSCFFATVIILLPSEFMGQQLSVIKSSASEGVLQLSSCSFAKQSNFLTPISYSLVSVTNGKLLLHGCAAENLIFSESPFVILQSVTATFEQSHFLSVTLQTASLLTAAEVGVQSVQLNSAATSEFAFKNCSFDKIVAKEGSSKSVIIADPLSSSLSLINCSATRLTSLESNKGGGMKIKFKAGGSLSVRGNSVSGTSVISSCSCSPSTGKGGFCCIDSVGVDADFVFEKIKFSDNVAFLGKNIFFLCVDLYSSVKPEQFSIDFDEWTSDVNAFSGMDTSYFTTKAVDLLAFIADYSSERIIVSSSFGADVKGCGKKSLPCASFSTGLKHVTSSSEPDQLVAHLLIEDLAHVERCFDVSEHEIGSLRDAHAEISIASSLTPLSSSSSSVGSEDCVLFNKKTLKLTLLRFSIPTEFTTSQSVLILSSSGMLHMTDCSIQINSETNKGIAYCLVEVRSGAFEMKDFSLDNLAFDSNPMRFRGKDVEGKMENCQFEELTLKFPLFSIPETHTALSGREHGADSSFSSLTNGDCAIELISCQMNGIRREDDGSCLLSCEAINSIKYKMNGCILNGCESKSSARGGSMLFTLGAGSNERIAFEINSTTMGKCIASTANGRGGGVYLDCGGVPAEGRNGLVGNENVLGFRFKNAFFSFNDAWSGRDVFILCVNIESQVSAEQFVMDFEKSVSERRNAIYGREIGMGEEEKDRDLIDKIMFFRGEQVFVSRKGEDNNGCGSITQPCKTINEVSKHVSEGRLPTIFVDAQASIEGEADLIGISLVPLDESCAILMNSTIAKSAEREYTITAKENVQIDNVAFNFGGVLKVTHSSLIGILEGKLGMNECNFAGIEIGAQFDGSLVTVIGGVLKITKSTFREFSVVNCIINCKSSTSTNMDRVNFEGLSGKCFVSCSGSTFSASQLTVSSAKAKEAIVSCSGNSTIALLQSVFKKIEVEDGSAIQVENNEAMRMEDNEAEVERAFSASLCTFTNVSCGKNEGRVISCLTEKSVQFINNTLSLCSCLATKGKQLRVLNNKDLEIDACLFDGWEEAIVEANNNGEIDEICRWDGSLVDVTNCQATIKETSIVNSSDGGITLFGGNITIEKGEFLNNNKQIPSYKSARRNIICSEDGNLNIISLKGGDGWERNTSLWILNGGCLFEGIVSERASPFFIPVLESVETREEVEEVEIVFKGKLLLPCNLLFMIAKQIGDEKQIEKFVFDESGYLSETEAKGRVQKETISEAGEEAEVRICILFGNADNPSFTDSFILKNKSESSSNGEGKITEGSGKSEWGVTAFICCAIILFIFAVIFVVVIVLMRKKLNEAEKKAKKTGSEYEQINENAERRRENNGGSFEMSEMPSTLLEGMTSQIPLLIDNDEEDETESPSTTNDETLNENEMSVYEFPSPRSEGVCVSGMPHSHSLNVISAKKPFREKEKRSLKTLYSTIHSVQGNFTLGTRAMDVVDGKEVVLAVAELFEHLISVGDERVEMMGRQLCPYSIFVEEGNNEIFVLAEKIEDEKEKGEMKRWKAPEVGNEDEEIEKAVVFTLGLILHEMTTGEETLSECEAEEAQEMMRDGVRPLTEGIEEEEIVEVMEKMWANEPNDRCTLGEVIVLLKKQMD
ncbi:uncharacterized protein MONOS_6799 [Monocercomonoides exilis]|uniref:uncharacterized protein n=1 Tax=Monocercomonoides exilis TaxID=2049356 RepID=UPI003559DF6C|nr:hypothetical protein MONOS_6799 [Monocercomonoides exilis]|eukprot:MONOS_6799.1-p1 / transcript=MONOS_6799.1 / gene=MONOS_6799 / organism=Monocercomonoides_exilis_PA203 / gene_product=unspecified product / transcript_product=unspecified product / location=Mono_scaffold00221:40964-51923(+) / protein_length=3340 / sequence_SO=supercontig / SO=protein_coding / is_pseudo=false